MKLIVKLSIVASVVLSAYFTMGSIVAPVDAGAKTYQVSSNPLYRGH